MVLSICWASYAASVVVAFSILDKTLLTLMACDNFSTPAGTWTSHLVLGQRPTEVVMLIRFYLLSNSICIQLKSFP